jgi:hypothetical protein
MPMADSSSTRSGVSDAAGMAADRRHYDDLMPGGEGEI